MILRCPVLGTFVPEYSNLLAHGVGVAPKRFDLLRGPVCLDMPAGGHALGTFFAAKNNRASPQWEAGAYAITGKRAAGYFIGFGLAPVSRDSFRDDVSEKTGLSDPVTKQNVVGGTVRTLGVKDGTGEVHVDHARYAVDAHPEVDPAVTDAREVTEHSSRCRAQAGVEVRVTDRQIVVGQVVGRLQQIGFEPASRRKYELDRSQREWLGARFHSTADQYREFTAIDIVVDDRFIKLPDGSSRGVQQLLRIRAERVAFDAKTVATVVGLYK